MDSVRWTRCRGTESSWNSAGFGAMGAEAIGKAVTHNARARQSAGALEDAKPVGTAA
jgi:hypothetical protein